MRVTKKDILLRWMLQRGTFRTSDVLLWGISNFHNRSDRDKRDFAQEGIIIALNDNQKKEIGLTTTEGVYMTKNKYESRFKHPQMEFVFNQ